MQAHSIRSVALLAPLAVLLACATPQVEPSFSRVGDTLELNYGSVVRVGDDGLMLAFREVPQDSRCPSKVTCLWSGDATVRLEVKIVNEAWSVVDLHTHVEPFEAEYGDYVIELHGLLPYPREGLPTRDRDYRASLQVRGR